MVTKKLKPTLAFAIISNLHFLLGTFIFIVLVGSFDEIKFVDAYAMPISILVFLYRVLLTRSHTWEIGSENIVYKRGVFSRKVDYLEMYRIRDYHISKPFLMRLIWSMNISLRTTDKNMPELKLDGVPDSEIIPKLRNLVELQRKNKNVYVID